MGIIVYMPLSALTVTAAEQDVFSVSAAAGSKIKLHGWELTSNAVDGVSVSCDLRRITASGSGGVAGVAETADESLAPSTAILRTIDTTIGAGGGVVQPFQWEQLGPLGMVYTPEMRKTSQPGEGFALTLRTPFVAATFSGWVCWEEL